MHSKTIIGVILVALGVVVFAYLGLSLTTPNDPFPS